MCNQWILDTNPVRQWTISVDGSLLEVFEVPFIHLCASCKDPLTFYGYTIYIFFM